MNKDQLLDSLEQKDFVDSIMSIENLNAAEANGASRFRVNYFEVVGNIATASSAEFYVIDTGTDQERAYWFQKEPTQTLGG